MAALQDVNDPSFAQDVLGAPGTVVVDFWADVNASLESGGISVFQGRESWQAGERQVYLRDRAIAAIVP